MSFGAQEALERVMLLVAGFVVGAGAVGLLVWWG
jgi:hypothetical protein